MFSEIINNILSKRDCFLEDLKRLEKGISNFLETNNQLSILSKFAVNKGKRIRSILYFSNWEPNHTDKKKYKTIALLELIHYASIMHDDVVDDNDTRRNSDSFMGRYGRKKSIVLGDFLLVKAIDELLKLHDKNNLIKNACMRECSATAYGAALERSLTAESSLTDCLKATVLKTAPLFKLSCFLSKVISTNDFKVAKEAAMFGTCFGTIFQIQNDLDSYKHRSFKDSEDFVQKNITLPLIILRDHLGFNMSTFYISNQDAYDEIKRKISSEQFKVTLQKLLVKPIRFASDF